MHYAFPTKYIKNHREQPNGHPRRSCLFLKFNDNIARVCRDIASAARRALGYADTSRITPCKYDHGGSERALYVTRIRVDLHLACQASIKLHVTRIGLDSMLEAANFIRTIETRQGLQIACLQEIAYENGWMNKAEIEASIQPMLKTEYGQYLKRMIEK